MSPPLGGQSVLPDTSVWVSYLRGTDPDVVARFRELLRSGAIVTCGQVAAEVLAGAPAGREAELWRLFEPVTWVHLDRGGWRRVGDTTARLRRSGASVPFTDVAIAVAAVQADAALWTSDSDFQRIASVLDGLSLLEI